MFADQSVKCSYCHQEMSIIESITEYGKFYHQDCKIHELSKRIDDYKKKWINKTLTEGDKFDLLDTMQLRKNMINNRTGFKGFQLIGEKKIVRRKLTKIPERLMLYQDSCGAFPVLENGVSVFSEDNSPSIEIRVPIMRPRVEKYSSKEKKLIEMKDLPKLLGIEE